MYSILQLIATIASIISFFVIAQVVLSWLIQFGVVNSYQPFVQSVGKALYGLTEPIYRPIRRVLPPISGIDLSPLVVIIFLQFLPGFLFEIFGYARY